MTFKDKMFSWIIGLVCIGLFTYMISGILLPFVVAMIASYFLDPAADKLEKFGISRTLATVTITVSFFVIVITIMLLIVPVIYDQFVAMINEIPKYINMANEKIFPYFASALEKFDPDAVERAKASISEASVYVFEFLARIMSNLWNSGLAIVNLLSLIFVTPVVTFYMLRDWNKIVSRMDSWLPPKYAPVIRKQFKKIDRTLSGYIHGQTNVCLFLGAFYAIGLTLVGLDFGFTIGLATGIFAFIPYVGLLFGFTVGIIIAFCQFGDFFHVMLVASVFLSGQALDACFITPKLVGDKVGLHPVWIIFGMLAGATMFGFIGILLAVPVTAITGVLTRFALKQYLKSSLYKV